jgi:Putative Flp pilus-assembly TadE/G-like
MRRPSRTNRRPGTVLPLVTICLVGLMAFLALGIDIGMMALARTQAQSAADIAALSGARTLTGEVGNNKANAEAEAREAARANAILNAPITDGQITAVNTGVFRYNRPGQRFDVDFQNPPSGQEAYGVMQVRIRADMETYFGKVLGINSIAVAAEATAVHRPRDVAIVLDFSGSMKFSSEFNYPPIAGNGSRVSGGLNPDPVFPRFGPWSIYPVATPGNPNPMQRVEAYIDSGGETHAVNNMTVQTANGPPIVPNFQTTPINGGPNAFVFNGDLSGMAFNITNTPVCTPAPATWTSQFAPGYVGDRWPLNYGNVTTAPAVTDYAKTVADVLGIPVVTSSTRNDLWETNGYDWIGLTSQNGPFQGYSMGPGYYGKTFYMWPPDPRFTAGADPTNISSASSVQDSSGRWIGDWRKRFFLTPSANPSNKGAPVGDNSRLFTNNGQWRSQGVGGTLNYVPNYEAILAWIKNGPKTLPPALRAGRVLYYDAIPNVIPMNWQTGVISPSASADERFWKGYIDFVLGAGEHDRNQTLYGYGNDNSWAGQTFGNSKITPAANLTGTPRAYMAYDDCPVHPRLNTWFGPLTMLAYLSINSDNQDYNWFAGTTYEAHCWQLKAGIQSAFDDIKRNHPNDQAALTFFNSQNGYNTVRVPMGKDYDQMRISLFYPYSLMGSLGTLTSEKRPYSTNNPSTANPSGINPFNYQADIPNADGGTNPTMGLMIAYNQFNWTGSYTGRKGAAKIVILETDGVANQRCNGTLTPISGAGGSLHWTTISNGGSAPNPMNGHPQALEPAISLGWLISQDANGSKNWPTFPGHTNGTGLATQGPPAKWSGLTANGPGYASARLPAQIHTIAFGYLFEDSTSSILKRRALEFLRDIQLTAGLRPDPTTGTIEDYKRIVGTYDQRIDKLRQALERIMQSGIQVALIE